METKLFEHLLDVLPLSKQNAFRERMELDAKRILEFTEIGHIKLGFDIVSWVCNLLVKITGDIEIITYRMSKKRRLIRSM